MEKKWEPMNRATAEDIFSKEAIMYGDTDGIPWGRAVELVGSEALAYADSMAQHSKTQLAWNMWTSPKKAKYCTRYGWKIAVTFNNIMAVGSKE